MEYFLLENRQIISIRGEDKSKFLQGIITNDVHKICSDAYIYALMLTPQGKILYDFFIIQRGDAYLLDCPKPYVSDIIKKFQVYKLRSNIEINDKSNHYKVYGSLFKLNDLFIQDPRNNMMGYRAILDESIIFLGNPQNFIEYELLRMELLIPDMVHDLESERYFPLELNLDALNAIDYQKGCYVGQEVTARTHYRGTVRKHVYQIEIVEGDPPPPKTEIFLGDKKIGQTLGSVLNYGLSLIRDEYIEEAKSKILNAGSANIIIIE